MVIQMHKNKKAKKRYVTLIEIMIVILLIGLIGGVLAYNFKGSLDQGRMFKTTEGMRQIHNILLYEVATGKSIDEYKDKKNWQDAIMSSPLAGRPKELLKDGWGEEYEVEVEDDKIYIKSTKGGIYPEKEGVTNFKRKR